MSTESFQGPLSIAKSVKYPPTCQIMGTEDDMFDVSHITDLGTVLDGQGIPHKEVIVPGGSHGFDIGAEVGDKTHLDFIQPALHWISQFVHE